MSLRAWRIVKSRFAPTAFTGDGARIIGGRWNHPGTPLVYAAGSISLATLEMLVHLGRGGLHARYNIFEARFVEDDVTTVDLSALPKSWRRELPMPRLRDVGTHWVAAGTSAVLRVPSAVIPSEWNYLLNPAHPRFAAVVIGPRQAFRFDHRLAGGGAGT